MSQLCGSCGRRGLPLSTRSSLISNGKALMDALSGSVSPFNAVSEVVNAENCTSGSPCGAAEQNSFPWMKDAMLVHLCVEDYKRSTFLEHAQYLYSIALSFSPLASISVIPCFPYLSGAAPLLTAPETAVGKGCCGEGLSLGRIREAHPEFGALPYSCVAVGGTFDRLHAGHKVLLTYAAFHTTQSLLVGVASDALLAKKKLKEILQPLQVRMENVICFLSLLRKDVSLEVIPIDDVYGSTDVRPELEAIILSEETKKSLKLINEARESHQLPPIEGVVIPTVTYGADETLISSTTLRELEQKQEESGRKESRED